jgi:uncharacterized membrane protein YgdD (TMEM256/DUF423 family)
MPLQDNWFSRLMLVFAGVLGAGGIVAAAAASHLGNERILGAIGLIALTHATAALAFGLMSATGRLLRIGAIAIAAGACLFSGALGVQQVVVTTLLPMLAPAGAMVVVAGWIVIAIAGVTGRR